MKTLKNTTCGPCRLATTPFTQEERRTWVVVGVNVCFELLVRPTRWFWSRASITRPAADRRIRLKGKPSDQTDYGRSIDRLRSSSKAVWTRRAPFFIQFRPANYLSNEPLWRLVKSADSSFSLRFNIGCFFTFLFFGYFLSTPKAMVMCLNGVIFLNRFMFYFFNCNLNFRNQRSSVFNQITNHVEDGAGYLEERPKHDSLYCERTSVCQTA